MPIELLASIFFILIALVFVGLGNVMGTAFNQAQDRLLAYISNIIGSLAGITAFALASYLWTSPMVWFAVVIALWLYFLRRRTVVQLYCGLAVLLLISFVSYNTTIRSPYQTDDLSQRNLNRPIWSPYYSGRNESIAPLANPYQAMCNEIGGAMRSSGKNGCYWATQRRPER